MKKDKEVKEETAVYSWDSSPAYLSLVAIGEEGVYITNTKIICKLPNLRESFRECALTKEFRSHYRSVFRKSPALLSGHFRTYMRILSYTILTRYSRTPWSRMAKIRV